MIKDAGRNIDFREYAARCLVRREGTAQVNLLVISIHSVIPGLPGIRLMVSRLASQGCEAIFLSMDRVSSLVLSPPVSLPAGCNVSGRARLTAPAPTRDRGLPMGFLSMHYKGNYWRRALVSTSSIT